MRKLSERSTDECLNTLCEITPYISNIVSDEEIMGNIGKAAPKKDMTAVGVMMSATGRIVKTAPLLLKTHREDVYQILAILGETTVDAISKQNFMVTLAQIRAVCKDKVLLDFFKSWANGDETE